jgi:uncharacterized protein with von Willebrand factor type A (vWA) domain
MKQPFLYAIFAALHEDDRWPRPGIGEYFLLVELLDREPGIAADLQLFAFACETLWAKTPAQQNHFRELFREWQAVLEAWLLLMQNAQANPGPPVPPKPGPDIPASDPGPDIKDPKTDIFDQRKDNGAEGKESSPGTVDNRNQEKEGFVEIAIGPGTATGQPSALPVPELSPRLPLSKRFLMADEYFPVSRRTLQQDWRKLASWQKGTGAPKPDLPATVLRIAREGIFFDFEYTRRASNRLSLFILADRGPGMDVFFSFGKELARAAGDNMARRHPKPWYFSDLPLPEDNRENGYQLLNEDRTAAISTAALLRPVIAQNRVVLIYSDAGAIRGKTPGAPELDATRQFVHHLLRHTAYVAWMNPAPQHRWKGTRAAVIAQEFPEIGMYEATRAGLSKVIDSLKGKITFKSIEINAQPGNE